MRGCFEAHESLDAVGFVSRSSIVEKFSPMSTRRGMKSVYFYYLCHTSWSLPMSTRCGLLFCKYYKSQYNFSFHQVDKLAAILTLCYLASLKNDSQDQCGT